MLTESTTVPWEEALRSFLLHLKAVRASKTVRFYDTQLSMPVRWANESGL
jgi:hypothetical protein